MSTTIMSNAITTGTRRLSTLGAWGLGAAPSDLAQQMITDGYDSTIIVNLSNANATDAQLQNLYDNYGAGTAEFALAANQLLSYLTGGPGGAASAPGYPASAVPTTVSTAFGVYDLTQQAAWDQISGQLSNVRDQINQVAGLAPKDPDVRQHVQDFNTRVGEFAGYYQQLFGSAPSSIPLASIPTLGVAPLVIPVAIVAAVVAIIAIAYSYGQWAQTKRAQIAAQSQAALLPLIPAGATPDQITRILNPGASTNLAAWAQNNMGMILFFIAVVALGPPLIKKL